MTTLELQNNDLITLKSIKLIVMGHKRHGKDTACEYLHKKYGITFTSSSSLACDIFIFDKIKSIFGYKTKEECFSDRENHRKIWYRLIKEFNTPDLAKLGKIVFQKFNAYCGSRDKEEFLAMKSLGLFDLSIWIDASLRLPPESEESMSLTQQYADIVLDNNKGAKEFEYALDLLVKDLILPIAKQKLILRQSDMNDNYHI